MMPQLRHIHASICHFQAQTTKIKRGQSLQLKQEQDYTHNARPTAVACLCYIWSNVT